MSELSSPYLTAIIGIPLLAALAVALGAGRRDPRRWALVAVVLQMALASAALREFHGRGARFLVDPWLDLDRWLGPGSFGVDGLSAALLPFAALIGAVAVLVAPRTRASAVDRDAYPGEPVGLMTRILVTQATTTAIFASHEARLVAVLWCLSLVAPYLQLRSQGASARSSARIYAIYMGAAALALVVGVALRESSPVGGALLVSAVMIRKGITPFHSWVPAVFERAPLGMSVLFAAPQIGAYTAVVLVVPSESNLVLWIVGATALVTAVYGAAMAVGQRDARRAYGYLFMSQSALVVAGLECVSLAGLTGALSLWISSGLALAGLGMALWVLEARRGRLRLDRFHGGYERMPLLAAVFLLLGLASVGFPGTMGFFGQELLVDGAVAIFPTLGFAVAVATALSGIAVIRMYFSLFCGSENPGRHPQWLRARETLGFALLGLVLVFFGLWPQAVVEDRARVASGLLDERSRLTGLNIPNHEHTGAIQPPSN